MTKSDRSRQQKLMKKRRKDKLRRKARAGMYVSESELERKRILDARAYPIHECLIGSDWRKQGLSQILLSRVQPDGLLVAGVYLVDLLCLGLKNSFARANLTQSAYNFDLRDRIREMQGLEPCDLDLAHTIIYGAIDFAARFGFRPQRDLKLTRHILEERDRLPVRDDVGFGRDGKPLFISGPHDDVRRIVGQLQATAGEGNFDFMIGGPVGESPDSLSAGTVPDRRAGGVLGQGGAIDRSI